MELFQDLTVLVGDITYLEHEEVGGAEHGIDAGGEKGQVAELMGRFQEVSDNLNLLIGEGGLLTLALVFVPGYVRGHFWLQKGFFLVCFLFILS